MRFVSNKRSLYRPDKRHRIGKAAEKSGQRNSSPDQTAHLQSKHIHANHLAHVALTAKLYPESSRGQDSRLAHALHIDHVRPCLFSSQTEPDWHPEHKW